MILVDTSVWIDHLSRSEPALVVGLTEERILLHEFVLGELALGNFRRRERALIGFDSMPRAPIASVDSVRQLIEGARLFGTGIGYVDCHLLASARSKPETKLWTRDKRLAAVAGRLALLADLG